MEVRGRSAISQANTLELHHLTNSNHFLGKNRKDFNRYLTHFSTGLLYLWACFVLLVHIQINHNINNKLTHNPQRENKIQSSSSKLPTFASLQIPPGLDWIDSSLGPSAEALDAFGRHRGWCCRGLALAVLLHRAIHEAWRPPIDSMNPLASGKQENRRKPHFTNEIPWASVVFLERQVLISIESKCCLEWMEPLLLCCKLRMVMRLQTLPVVLKQVQLLGSLCHARTQKGEGKHFRCSKLQLHSLGNMNKE